uniref:Cilia and flagella associated protein 77 n=1 Tax=Cyprinus carpio TaxID=7962 RepID=A0A8C2GIL4_CYPCA
MESPRVGVVRESMLHRPLLIKPALGKTKSRGLSYPGPDFVFGTATTVQDGGVPEAISSWHSHTMSTRNREAERDFIALNREGVKSGLVTAKELHQYRATHDIRQQPLTREGFRRSAPARIPPDASFGITNRPSTPISELMEYKYAQKWLEEQHAKDKILQAHRHKKAQLGRIQDTRTTMLRKSRPLPEPPSMWKMPRFQQLMERERSVNLIKDLPLLITACQVAVLIAPGGTSSGHLSRS